MRARPAGFKYEPQTCPGCGGRMRQVALVLAASGDVLRWLDDERVGQSGLVLLGARVRGDPPAMLAVR